MMRWCSNFSAPVPVSNFSTMLDYLRSNEGAGEAGVTLKNRYSMIGR